MLLQKQIHKNGHPIWLQTVGYPKTFERKQLNAAFQNHQSPYESPSAGAGLDWF